MRIKIKYNGRKFPRTLLLRNRKRVSFHSSKLIIDIDEFDALDVLSQNIRISDSVWEFTINQDNKIQDNKIDESEIPESVGEDAEIPDGNDSEDYIPTKYKVKTRKKKKEK